MIVKVIIGANYGDEGKGLMTDYFSAIASKRNENCIVICTNGGSQRGHTVVTPSNHRHIFSHFGAGTFENASTYFPKYYILNPLNFSLEYKELSKYGLKPQTFFNKECLWSTPYDMIANQVLEESRGDKKHGSCGIGIWETILRNQMKNSIDILHFHYLSYAQKKDYLMDVKKYFSERIAEITKEKIPIKWQSVFNSEKLIENFIIDVAFFIEHSRLATDEIIYDYSNVIFENGQGLLLDQNQGEKIHTTQSNTGMQNITEFLKKLRKPDEIEVCYVTRTYLTRHGAGPFESECNIDEIGQDIVDLTNKTNPHQGMLRYGRLCLAELKKRVFDDYKKDANTMISLAVTHTDETNNKFILTEYEDVSEFYSDFDKIYMSNGASRNNIKIYR